MAIEFTEWMLKGAQAAARGPINAAAMNARRENPSRDSKVRRWRLVWGSLVMSGMSSRELLMGTRVRLHGRRRNVCSHECNGLNRYDRMFG
ncbi:hypothetical protein RSSM_04860 [Rhodopirellula sallentina SM41]|uniref:Uncharacterized protein n=1 Tax=Rhodopirellula sallentina SM41 TaxID=1263870 RepID=M5TXI4_9BACT|nr:hypothetical protein RSSM_04860 [Rhodopirellula sallentina SM41]